MTEAAGGYTLHCVATSESTLISGAQWLCHEYAAELFEVSGLDLRTATFQTFTAEVNALPGKYAPENGGLLVVATAGDSPADPPVGIVAYKTLLPGVAEMKRLYVVPSARKAGLGVRLCHTIMAAAAQAGHTIIKLDTLPCLASAVQIYTTKLGFRPIEPYCENGRDDALFFGANLGRSISFPSAVVPMPDPCESNAVRLMLPRYAAARPAEVALVANGESATWGELESVTSRLGLNLMESAGVVKGERGCVVGQPLLATVEAVLAVLRIGGVAIWVDDEADVLDNLSAFSVVLAGGRALATLTEGIYASGTCRPQVLIALPGSNADGAVAASATSSISGCTTWVTAPAMV